jgi:hypothetical protein
MALSLAPRWFSQECDNKKVVGDTEMAFFSLPRKGFLNKVIE